MRVGPIRARLALFVAVGVGISAMAAAPAGAHISDGCSGEAIFPDGVVVNPAEGDEFTVARSGSVDWFGQIGDGTEETPERTHSGRAEIQLPPLASSILGLFSDDSEPDVRTWGVDDATTTFDDGSTKYEIPIWVPAGARVRVEAVHIDPVQNCDGYVILIIDGNPFASPTTLIALGGLVLSIVGLVLALRAKPDTYDPVRGSPILGFIAGGFLGAFLAPLLWALGVIPLDSAAWLALPILGAIGGMVGGLFPPFNRPSGRPAEPGGPEPDADDDMADPLLADAPSAPRPAADIGPAGASRTLSEMESDAGES
ncbi:MAG: hypothetical protein ACR2QE_12415 [Acidimicrobiales bacterium]